MNCEPVIEVFSLGQLHHLSQIDAGVQACLVMKDADLFCKKILSVYLSLLVKRIFHCPRLKLLLWSEGFLLVKYFTELCKIHLDSADNALLLSEIKSQVLILVYQSYHKVDDHKIRKISLLPLHQTPRTSSQSGEL